jgi:aspartate racemase
MEDGFFAKYFTNQGIDIIIPSFEERVKIQEIQTQISTGVSNDDFYNDFKNIITNYLSSAEAVCLACTELPLYINNTNCPLPIINPINLQCIEAVNFAIN